jgi:starch phosphorylase
MKAALNGGLNLSIRDGWWDEMFDSENGWAIPSAAGVADPTRRDELEAAAFYNLVETQVAPRFYAGDHGGVPTRWVEMVRHTLKSLGPRVLADRMVRDYVDQLYTPAAASSARLAEDGYAGARGLAAWRSRVLAAWPGVYVRHVESSGVGDTPELGATLSLRAEVELGGLRPGDVCVQAAYGQVDADNGLLDVQTVAMTCVGNGADLYHYEGIVPLERTGPFGYTVRVLPDHDLLATPAELGVVTVAS